MSSMPVSDDTEKAPVRRNSSTPIANRHLDPHNVNFQQMQYQQSHFQRQFQLQSHLALQQNHQGSILSGNPFYPLTSPASSPIPFSEGISIRSSPHTESAFSPYVPREDQIGVNADQSRDKFVSQTNNNTCKRLITGVNCDSIHANSVKAGSSSVSQAINRTSNKDAVHQAHAPMITDAEPVHKEDQLSNLISGTISTTETASSTTTTMPITTMITTSTMTTALAHPSSSGTSSAMTALSTTFTTSSCVITESESGDNGNKIKSSADEEPKQKRRNLDNSANKSGSETLMQKMLSELCGIKVMINQVDMKIATIQDENKLWSSKLDRVINDVSGLKDSVDQAHLLINQEKTERVSICDQL